MKEKLQHWVIEVSTWGELHAIGTEDQAEEWRRHKAEWEGGAATKRLATQEEILANEFESLAELLE